jgi:hypothetical protein
MDKSANGVTDDTAPTSCTQRHAIRGKRVRRSLPPAPAGPDALLTPREAAAELRIALPTLWRGVAQGRLPAPLYPLPRCPRWRRADLHRAAGVTV